MLFNKLQSHPFSGVERVQLFDYLNPKAVRPLDVINSAD